MPPRASTYRWRKAPFVIVLVLLSLIPVWGLFAQTEARKSFSEETPKAGSISVTIGGFFVINGSFPATAFERVDQFVTRIYNSVLSQQRASSSKAETDFARRNIKLKRVGGEVITVDLEKFRLTGDFKYNPYLRNDDVLIFPAFDLERDFVSVSGAVSRSARFHFSEGDRLSDALLFAGGINDSYDSVSYVLISRLDPSGQHDSISTYQIADNPFLKRGDRVQVVAGTNERKDFRVTVAGEVNFPGSVPISKNTTTLREVLKRVGGFKPTADLNRAELIRGANVFQSLFFNDEFEHLLMLRTADITAEDSASFSVDNKLRVARGNGLIDFNRVMDDTSAEGNFLVRDGDFIMIPERLSLVYVFGQVKNPGYVQYASDADPSYYLAKAGGVTQTATGRMYLIKGKTRAWKEIKGEHEKDARIDPGDFLWVPKDYPRDFNYYVTRVGSIAQIVAALATVALLVKQFK